MCLLLLQGARCYNRGMVTGTAMEGQLDLKKCRFSGLGEYHSMLRCYAKIFKSEGRNIWMKVESEELG